MSKHTLGPWEIDEQYVQQAGKADVGICDVLNMDEGGSKGWYRGPVTEANARLIAAAPDLLEALTALLPMVAEWHAEFPQHVGDKETPAIQSARAAIAKATEAQP